MQAFTSKSHTVVSSEVQVSMSQAAVPSTSFFGSTFLGPKLAELIRLPKENFFEMVSGRISALVIVMKSVMRLAGGARRMCQGCSMGWQL